MQTVNNVAELRQIIRQWRQAGQSIGFVPTMGNLHAGHIRLVETAKTQADKVVVSIFVNPTQFGPNEDFDSYPRTETQDAEKLAACSADLLFLPGVAEIYPQASQTRVSVAGLSALHCGASRPGHFDGVALVVCKLLNMVQPDLLLLGEKDFQQLTLIRQMVADLNIPVTVRGVATVREADGLAMSSRNGYLNESQRQTAPALYRALISARDTVLAGAADYRAVEEGAKRALQAAGFNVDYFSVCRIADLQSAEPGDAELVVLAAAKLGSTRLIDNVYFCMPSA
ncbi:pantoate--beta-alanine ligase [Methylomonas sp. SURF-1]|uniref:Pantothenate synthetase n=1 Tax=Methylomonas aurea TaxID=2952224 RepID=A0ABT1ULE1_9GAMM|nr:pantoate--beta-alanine ligase [Methylomonas sp. SURF-1]MCQ8182922.1 pantoate--beta-alanine ligase [Methylomonas sp. SURF-1]